MDMVKFVYEIVLNTLVNFLVAVRYLVNLIFINVIMRVLVFNVTSYYVFIDNLIELIMVLFVDNDYLYCV
jgi:hypothetical protein